jgi:hypothetical protein
VESHFAPEASFSNCTEESALGESKTGSNTLYDECPPPQKERMSHSSFQKHHGAAAPAQHFSK